MNTWRRGRRQGEAQCLLRQEHQEAGCLVSAEIEMNTRGPVSAEMNTTMNTTTTGRPNICG
jgi:hypothetical protein